MRTGFVRGRQAIPEGSSLRAAYAVAFWFVALCFISGRLLERTWTSAVSNALIWIGSFWVAAMQPPDLNTSMGTEGGWGDSPEVAEFHSLDKEQTSWPISTST